MPKKRQNGVAIMRDTRARALRLGTLLPGHERPIASLKARVGSRK
jgi:hypothetical protein